MAYLEFNKEELVNLEYSLKREILLSNRAGGYVNTTIVGCNTRKYHGLLVVPIDNFNGEKHILLSTVHESLVQHDKVFNLGINSYGDIYDPKGHKYIVDFEMNYASTITYRVGGMLFSKTILFLRDREEVFIKYTLIDAHSATKLRIKPFLAFRNIHALTHANTDANVKYEALDNGVGFRLYDGFPQLSLQLNKKNEWIASPDWYKNIVYKEEARRGFECCEDLFVPGYFELPIKKGESIIFSASTAIEKPMGFKARFESEVIKRDNTRVNYEACLKLAAKQFIIKRNGNYEICSGYSWCYENLRTSFIALPGLTIYNDGDGDRFETILDNMLSRVKGLLLHYEKAPDIPLWYVRCVQEFLKWGGAQKEFNRKKAVSKYLPLCKEIVDSYLNGVYGNTRVTEQGMLWSEEKDVALSWMSAYNAGKPVTERPGLKVEVNALWYNALKFVETELKLKNGPVVETAEKIEENFTELFYDKERKQLYDYIYTDGVHFDTRPNQLIAVSLPYSPLDEVIKIEVLRKVDKELLTVRGIRTLSPKNPVYKGVYEGDQTCRDLAHHNGCTFPWLLGCYVDAKIMIEGAKFVKKGKQLLGAFEEDINIHGIGSVAEIYDGDPSHSPHGCISSAASVAEIIRGEWLLDNVKKLKNR